jgi:hypothetical protein
VAAFGDWMGGLWGSVAGQGQPLGAYTAAGSDWVTATTTINLGNIGDLYALQQPQKIALRGPESALEWLDRRVSEICVKL